MIGALCMFGINTIVYNEWPCCFLKDALTSVQERDAVSTTRASAWSAGQLKTVTWGRVAVVTMATVKQDSVSVTLAGMELTVRTKRRVTR